MQLTPTQEVLIVTAVIASGAFLTYKLDRSFDYESIVRRSGDSATDSVVRR